LLLRAVPVVASLRRRLQPCGTIMMRRALTWLASRGPPSNMQRSAWLGLLSVGVGGFVWQTWRAIDLRRRELEEDRARRTQTGVLRCSQMELEAAPHLRLQRMREYKTSLEKRRFLSALWGGAITEEWTSQWIQRYRVGEKHAMETLDDYHALLGYYECYRRCHSAAQGDPGCVDAVASAVHNRRADAAEFIELCEPMAHTLCHSSGDCVWPHDRPEAFAFVTEQLKGGSRPPREASER